MWAKKGKKIHFFLSRHSQYNDTRVGIFRLRSSVHVIWRLMNGHGMCSGLGNKFPEPMAIKMLGRLIQDSLSRDLEVRRWKEDSLETLDVKTEGQSHETSWALCHRYIWPKWVGPPPTSHPDGPASHSRSCETFSDSRWMSAPLQGCCSCRQTSDWFP